MLTQKQETFCLEYFKTRDPDGSYILAGYSSKFADVNVHKLLKNTRVRQRLDELNQRAEDDAVAGVLERKKVLSEILRARMTDFIECGADGAWINIGLESTHSAALQEVTSRTEYDENGAHPTVITKLKLHDPVKSISELNKMGGDYPPERHVNLNVDVKFVIGRGYVTDGNNT
ncbi:hypothetical protein LCGC14_0420620 [marine sediment metagenome]|uniref:Terminase small subunit n=1 Tax=marine sediment metagenome TaxID=412755 RepID=A0A0F9W094_9ZZZZ